MMNDDELRALGQYLDSRNMEAGEALVTLARAMGASVYSLASDDADRRALLDRLVVAAEASAGLMDRTN